MPRVVAYARASLDHADPAAQLEQLATLAADLGLDAPVPFVDLHGHADTPAWHRLRAACRRGEVEVLLVTALHRLTASLNQLDTLLAELERWGVRLIAEDDHLDTATSTGRIVTRAVHALSHFQMMARSERVREGMERAREQGRHVGRPTKATL